MAKSNGFFTLRRGSTKSLTFSVYNGKQITKDRVSKVSNPKSQKQQYQRAIMATVMAAYSGMKEIVDHSFQGKSKGSENQREFMSRNLVAMRNAFAYYQEENPTPDNLEFFAVAPKTPTVLPNAWKISSGTLAETPFLRYDDSNHTLKIDLPTVDQHYNITAAKLANEIGVFPGMQITFCCISAANGIPVYQLYDEDYAKYVNFEFHYARIVFKNYDQTKVYNGDLPEPFFPDGDANANALMLFLQDAIDFEKSTVDITHGLAMGTGVVTIDAELALTRAQFDESLTGAIGIITSKVDEDLRSTSYMQVRNVVSLKDVLGLSWEYVWDAWRNVASSVGESDLYLEGGSI